MMRLAPITALLLFTIPVFAGGDWPPQGKDDPKIRVEKKLQDDSHGIKTSEISVVIEDHPPILLGEHDEYGEEKWRQMGVNPDTVRVRLLKGTPDLYLIEWIGLTGGGSGNYVPYRYRISPAKTPADVLASGTVMLSGKGGWSRYGTGRSKITYGKNQLTIIEFYFTVNTETEPKPLHHFVPEKGDFWQAQFRTRITRTFSITKTGAKLERTAFAYRVQEGDRCEDVLSVFKLEEDWLEEPTLPAAGKWVTAEVPPDVATKRWPTIETTEK